MTKVFYPITSKSHFSSSFNLSLSYLVILHFIILYHHRVTMYHKYKLSTMHPSRKKRTLFKLLMYPIGFGISGPRAI